MPKKNLSTQTKNLFFIVHVSDVDFEDLHLVHAKLISWLEDNASRWAFSLHHLDMHEDGSPVSPHYHVLFDLKKRARIYTTLNRLSDALGLNPLAIQVDEYTNFEACFRYLIHKGFPNKYQYPREYIRSNLSDKDRDLILDEEEPLTLDFEGLLSICLSEDNAIAVMKKIGISYYKYYRSVINDIFRFKNSLSSAQIENLFTRS